MAAAETPAAAGTQTLLRGLDLLEAVANGPVTLAALCEALQVNRSTVHRLASALVERGYLRLSRPRGYSLGRKLLELGFAARRHIDLARIAQPFLEDLAEATSDTVHLGVLDGDKALYLDKVPGSRRIEIGSRVGERQPLCSTGLGKALLLDDGAPGWQVHFAAERPRKDGREVTFRSWRARMEAYVRAGCAFDLEENEDQIRCVAAPVRDASGRIVAAISVASAAHYMSDARMAALSTDVVATAEAISRELGWRPPRA